MLDGFNNKMQETVASNQEVAQSSSQTGDSMGNLTSSLVTLGAGFVTLQGVMKLANMTEFGQKVHNVNEVFAAYTTTLGGTNEAMKIMQDNSGGVVDKLTLASGSIKALSDGLITSKEDLAKFTNLSVRLGESVGMPIAQAFETMTKTLENGSVRGLAAFGISADEVRAKVKKLTDAGEDSKTAFREATFDVAQKQVDRLGSSATAAETPLAKMAARARDIGNALQESLATGANNVASFIVGNAPAFSDHSSEQSASALATLHQNMAADFARQNFGDMMGYLDMSGVKPASDAFVSKLMFETANALENNPDLDVSGFISHQLAAGWAAGEHIAPTDTKGYVDSFTMVMSVANSEIEANISNQQAAMNKRLAAEYNANGGMTRDWDKPIDIQAQQYAALLAGPDDRQASMQQQAQAAALAAQYHGAMGGINGSMTGAFGSMGYDTSVTDPSMFAQKIDPSYMQSLVPHYMQQGGADQVTADLRTAEDEFAKLQEMSKQKLIGDDQLNNAKNMVDNLKVMSDTAQKAADAFKNLKLADALGKSSGGMAGEVEDQVLAQMKTSGASKAQIEAMQAAMDKKNGRSTESSTELESKIVPMIAKMSAEHAATAMANLDAFLKEATLEGLTPEQIAAMMPGVIAGSGKKGKNTFDLSTEMPNYIAGQTATTSSGSKMFGDIAGDGEGTGGMAGKTGKKPLDGMMASVRQDLTTIAKDSTTLDTHMKATADNTVTANTHLDAIKKTLASIPAENKLRFIFSADDPQGLIPVVKAVLSGGVSLSDMQRASGDNSSQNSQPGRGH